MGSWNKSELELWIDWYDQILNAYTSFSAPSGTNASTVDYWLNDYNNASLTEADVVQNLTALGVWNNFTTFYQQFFGTNGLVTLTFPLPSGAATSNMTVST